MNHRIRLGPIAIFLVVIAIILTTLAVLTLSTTNADKVMAERFAFVTSLRYELEAEGQQYLQQYAESAKAGDRIAGNKTIEKDGYTLNIRLTDPDAEGNFEISEWEITKNWKAEDPFDNIWKGANQ